VTDNFLQIVHLPGQKESSVIHGKLSGAIINRVKFMVKFFLFSKFMLIVKLLFMVYFILVFLLPNCIVTEFYFVFFSAW